MDSADASHPRLFEKPRGLEPRLTKTGAFGIKASEKHIENGTQTLKNILLNELDILRRKIENDEIEDEDQQTIYEYINFCNGGSRTEDITEISKFYVTGWWLYSLLAQKETSSDGKNVEGKN